MSEPQNVLSLFLNFWQTYFPVSVTFLFFYPAILTAAVPATLWIFPLPLEIINQHKSL